ncbi:unnamed protein product [Nesidiocoris tenuis]|uniref:Uncharacterized protein n=1 Tax=Nesidiocoris tenuis TaxID=355587 RepID=A0A6H5G1E1_9HEMI|nr:unnamed protein product [Nesidiocoris tenuis]
MYTFFKGSYSGTRNQEASICTWASSTRKVVNRHPSPRTSSRKHLFPNPTSGRQLPQPGHSATAEVSHCCNCRVHTIFWSH